MAIVERDSGTDEIPISEVNVEDILVIRPGASIPVDAEVISGLIGCR